MIEDIYRILMTIFTIVMIILLGIILVFIVKIQHINAEEQLLNRHVGNETVEFLQWYKGEFNQ